jgi:hypothetical protein
MNGLVLLVAIALSGCVAAPAAEHGEVHADHGDQETVTSPLQMSEEWSRDGDWIESPALSAPAGATRVTALITLLAAGNLPPIEARATIGGEPTGDWIPLGSYFSENEAHVAVGDFDVVADGAQIRVHETDLESFMELRWAAIVPEVPSTSEGSEVVARSEGLRSELRGLGIVTREEWGATATGCTGTDSRRNRFSIHHTEGPSTNPMTQMRSIQSFHKSKGWCDIGYHFLIDTDGRIYEGRPVHLLGAHVRSNNTGNLGVSFIGCFDTGACRGSPSRLTDTMLTNAGRLIGTLAALYSVPSISSSNVKGHRDQVSTTCPGNILYPRIADIIAIARTSTLGGGSMPPVDPPPAPTPSDPPAAGAGCTHSFGGSFVNRGCSEEFQCCDGRWLSRASGCGTCACVEGSGRTGCSTATPPPVDPTPTPTPTPAPTGASCTHSFGGRYASTACSASYQCCDGTWETRASGCGTCFCVEETGTSGCGMSAPPPPTGGGTGAFAGLTQSGSEIPRAGLENGTLRSTLGIATEPYGTVVTSGGESWVRGRVSWFGGPRDTGVTATETGAVSGERLRSLNDPVSPSASTLMSRPADYYFVAMRWNYRPNSTTWWRNARILVRNPTTGRTVVARPVDWGPNTSTRRVVDVSPQVMTDLGVTTDNDVDVAFAAPGTPLGPL